MADEQEKKEGYTLDQDELGEGINKALGDSLGLGAECAGKAGEAVLLHGFGVKDLMGLEPDQMEGVYGQAYRLFNNGQYAQAKSIFRVLAHLDCMEPKYSLGIAACLHMEQKYDLAAASYYIVTQVDPENPVPLYHKADCHRELDELNNAQRDLKLTIKLCGKKPEYAIIKDRATMSLKSVEKELAKKAKKAKPPKSTKDDSITAAEQ
ncbi:Uncharacterized protein SCG7086_AN_00210 [Chlamydiales bacterium SCGC AG-110-P3]|nr:Uncharacterized protein SCG7086_AN_00210 [Chlamydiales bacterium SCGC AG-110-P3]